MRKEVTLIIHQLMHNLRYYSVHPHSLSMSSLWLAAKVMPNSLPLLSYSAELLVKIDSMWLENPCNCCACGHPIQMPSYMPWYTVNLQLPKVNHYGIL